ncbi:MAG: CPBP family intramembrane metalloprotease [Candidatus Omnitrophica bacterium]|nr:CPBP family intramembrane metalloprotease [Candidatus Omnitrophota bacterium]
MDFIKKERIYIWMLIFILGISLLNIGHSRKKELADKRSISSMTFQDMGVTEEKIKLFFESEKPGAVLFKYGLFAGVFMLLAGVAMNLFFLLGKKKMEPTRAKARGSLGGILSGHYLSAALRPRFCGRECIIPEKVPDKISVSWGIADVLRAVIIVVFSGYMLGALTSAASKLFHFNIDPNLGMILGTFFIDVIAGIVIFYFVLVKYREKLSRLGIASAGFYKNVLSGITAYVFILPILISVLILSMLFLNSIGYKFQAQPVFDMFLEEKRSNVILFLTIFVSILGPIIEEIFFRGFLYSAVRKRFGVLSGVLLSAALFSMLHTNIAGFAPIMILGILMAFLYETTGSLIAPMAVHILHNSIIVGFVFFIKELIR